MSGVAGLDYGHGRTNIDLETGIRFGVISQNSIMQAWADTSEAICGDAACPECGGKVVDFDKEIHGDYVQQEKMGCADFACDHCEQVFDSSECYPEEPLGWAVDDGEYKMEDCLDNDVMVLESPFYTFARFCSPCVPGAGDLNNTVDGGVKTYCLNHDWFEDDKAPYPVYRVSDDSLVEAPK